MTKVVIQWASTPKTTHVATFVKGVVGIRGQVETYIDRPDTAHHKLADRIPDRVEWAPMHKLLPELLAPGGRYRIAPLLAKTFQAQIEALFDSEPETESEPQSNPNVAPVYLRLLEGAAA